MISCFTVLLICRTLTGATVGGAVDTSKLIFFSDISPTGLMDYVSSNSGDTTQSIVLTGRDSTGVIVTENKTFIGREVFDSMDALIGYDIVRPFRAGDEFLDFYPPEPMSEDLRGYSVIAKIRWEP